MPESARRVLAVVLYGLLANVLVEGWIDASKKKCLTTIVKIPYGASSPT